MKENKEKYLLILKKIYKEFKPEGVSIRVKFILAILAIAVSLLISLMRNLIV